MRSIAFLFLGFLCFSSPLGLLASEAPVYEDRDEIPEQYKWDLSLFYNDWEEWEADLKEAERLFMRLDTFRGRLGDSPEVLREAFELSDAGGILFTKVFGYASFLKDLDTRDNEVQAQFGKLLALYSKISSQLSWIDPEILTIPEEQMRVWLNENEALNPYAFGLMETYRTGKYILSAEGERLLSLHGKVRRAPQTIYSALTNADGPRPEYVLADGKVVTVTPGLYGKALNQYPNPLDRLGIQELWMRQFEERRNTFASIYSGVLSQGWAEAESRGYTSTLAMRLDQNNIPKAVIDNLIESARSGANELQRYHELRKEFMELDRYGWSDMHIPLISDENYYAYEEMVPLVVESVAPLGADYQERMQEQFKAGFVDVFETPGKQSGAYNASRYGVGSFVLLNYHGTLEDVFTLAHEMGHSMHSRLSQEFQPYSTHRYTIFVAEVASTLNEKLLLSQLLKRIESRGQRIAFLEHQIGGIVGTFFLQSMMADFEMRAHALVEAGEGITAEKLTQLWKETVSAYHGSVIPEDDPYMYSWARIPHLYNSPFYVYQYATCYASSAYLMEKMNEQSEIVSDYIELLKSGGNNHPMVQLQDAGVDLLDPNVFQAVIEEFRSLVDLLEDEYRAYLNDTPAGA